MVDFDRGSVFYQLDIKKDRLNTKENRDNWNRAFAYSDMLRKTKGEITTYSPKYLYKIFLYEKEAYKKIISFEADLNSTIITTRRV